MPQIIAPLGSTSTEATGIPVWRRLFDQLTHFFAAMLWVAGALAIVGSLPELGWGCSP